MEKDEFDWHLLPELAKIEREQLQISDRDPSPTHIIVSARNFVSGDSFPLKLFNYGQYYVFGEPGEPGGILARLDLGLGDQVGLQRLDRLFPTQNTKFQFCKFSESSEEKGEEKGEEGGEEKGEEGGEEKGKEKGKEKVED